MLNNISNCCGASMKVVGGDEGTNHYECTKCHKACNPASQPLKEECICIDIVHPWYGLMAKHTNSKCPIHGTPPVVSGDSKIGGSSLRGGKPSVTKCPVCDLEIINGEHKNTPIDERLAQAVRESCSPVKEKCKCWCHLNAPWSYDCATKGDTCKKCGKPCKNECQWSMQTHRQVHEGHPGCITHKRCACKCKPSVQGSLKDSSTEAGATDGNLGSGWEEHGHNCKGKHPSWETESHQGRVVKWCYGCGRTWYLDTGEEAHLHDSEPSITWEEVARGSIWYISLKEDQGVSIAEDFIEWLRYMLTEAQQDNSNTVSATSEALAHYKKQLQEKVEALKKEVRSPLTTGQDQYSDSCKEYNSGIEAVLELLED